MQNPLAVKQSWLARRRSHPEYCARGSRQIVQIAVEQKEGCLRVLSGKRCENGRGGGVRLEIQVMSNAIAIQDAQNGARPPSDASQSLVDALRGVRPHVPRCKSSLCLAYPSSAIQYAPQSQQMRRKITGRLAMKERILPNDSKRH